MTSLTSSSFMVALMQTATTLPVLLLGLPAGALADVVDRRRMLLFTQAWMLVSATMLGILTLLEVTTPWVLLILTFALGAGAAMNAPAWQATAPELVSRAELSAAVGLTGIGLNLARAVGPALGGAVIAMVGPSAVFLLNAGSFLSVIEFFITGVVRQRLAWHRPNHCRAPSARNPLRPLCASADERC